MSGRSGRRRGRHSQVKKVARVPESNKATPRRSRVCFDEAGPLRVGLSRDDYEGRGVREIIGNETKRACAIMPYPGGGNKYTGLKFYVQ